MDSNRPGGFLPWIFIGVTPVASIPTSESLPVPGTFSRGGLSGKISPSPSPTGALPIRGKARGTGPSPTSARAIRLKPDFVFAFNNRGNAYYAKGQFDRAIKDYDEAIRLKPDLAEAFSNRGNVYRKKGQFDRAIEDYDKAIHLKPEDGQVFANRGLAYEKKGDPSQALRDFKKAYALGYRHPLLLRKLNEFGTPL